MKNSELKVKDLLTVIKRKRNTIQQGVLEINRVNTISLSLIKKTASFLKKYNKRLPTGADAVCFDSDKEKILFINSQNDLILATLDYDSKEYSFPTRYGE